MDKMRREFAVLEELERKVAALDDMAARDPEIAAMNEIEKIHFMMGTSASRGTTLILSKEQRELLDKYVRKHPFPTHSTLMALASRLGLGEQHLPLLQGWFRMRNSYAPSLPPPSCSSSTPSVWVGASWSTYFLICPSCKRDHFRRPEEFSLLSEARRNLQGDAQESSWPRDEEELEEALKRLSTAEPEEGDLEDTDELDPGDF
ncbi:uncharacterized protein LOC124100259 isoform X1 [Marmota monax]|uniref:uncharacterized protein LOC124100259 isoform X1 n=1 Tax=Marmota monax TaxID=9995 RepID=UPI001EB0AA68|nr:uncharacterized protein LOC124100259 isoform X1 [Marmota monax]